MPCCFAIFAAIASRSSGMPAVGVYFVKPWSIATFAASLMDLGVSKSGSPAPKPTTSMPFAFISFALAVMARVGEGFTASRRFASFILGSPRARTLGLAGPSAPGNAQDSNSVIGCKRVPEPSGSALAALHGELAAKAVERHRGDHPGGVAPEARDLAD